MSCTAYALLSNRLSDHNDSINNAYMHENSSRCHAMCVYHAFDIGLLLQGLYIRQHLDLVTIEH